MTKGIRNVEYIRQGSEVTVADQSNWGFINDVSTTKHRTYNLGDRVVTPDGRVFRYAKAGVGGVASEFGASQLVALKNITNAVAPAQVNPTSAILGVVPTSGVIGSTVVTITVGASDGVAANGALALDELAGGYIVIGNGTSQHPQMRGILGNDVLAAGGGSVNVYLDAPLTAAVVVSTTNIEAMLNPYANMVSGNVGGNGYQSFLGIPATTATVGQYFWLQTWGPCWITSDGTTGAAVNGRELFFMNNGSVVSSDKVVDGATNVLYQRAGFAIDNSSAGASNGPFAMLQISI